MYSKNFNNNMHKNATNTINSQQGFTLVELLVTITLGVLISAAIIQVFITSQRVDSIQRSGSEIQNSSIFGLQAIERQIRMANLGNDGNTMSDITPNSGIVVSTDNVFTGTAAATLTVSGKPSNFGTASDQLTIQYKNVVTANMGVTLFDCTGTEIAIDDIAIQRYYLQPTADGVTDRFNLMCKAGRVKEKNPATLTTPATYTMTDFETGNAGAVVVIDNVDQFNIRLGLSKKEKKRPQDVFETKTYYDMSVTDYMAMTTAKPMITSIRMAVIVRGSGNSPEDGNNKFTVFGKEQTLKTAIPTNVIRRVFETSILLRNGRVMDTAAP